MICSLIFYWVFVPWLQCELDAYQDCMNNTAKYRDRNKILPHGVPELVYTSPEDYRPWISRYAFVGSNRALSMIMALEFTGDHRL